MLARAEEMRRKPRRRKGGIDFIGGKLLSVIL